MKFLSTLILIICTSSVFSQGTYTFLLDADSVGYGTSSSTIMIFGELKNTGNVAVVLDVIRVQNNLPTGWQSTICTDVCYPPSQDTTLIQILIGDSSYFDFSFYTTSLDTGYATILVRNQAAPTVNVYLQQFIGIANIVGQAEVKALKPRVEIFPNPVTSRLNIDVDEQIQEITIYNLSGKLMQRESTNNFSVNHLPEGHYLINVKTETGIAKTRFVRVE